MSPVPSHLPPLPANYVADIATLRRDQRFPAGALFAEPRDPGSVLARAGDENFQRSVIIGRRYGQHLVLTFEDDRWTYRVANWSERGVKTFDTLDGVLAIMR
jgi:hypothetical protein